MKNKNIVSKNGMKKLEIYNKALEDKDFKILNLKSDICLLVLNNTNFIKLYDLEDYVTEKKILGFKRNLIILQEASIDGMIAKTTIEIKDNNLLETILSEFDIEKLSLNDYINLYAKKLKKK